MFKLTPISCWHGLIGLVLGALTLPVLADTPVDTGAFRSPVQFGGCGGVYLLADAGELWVEIEKQDLNRKDRNTHLRAILAGSDRDVIMEKTLPEDGQAKGSGRGPVQRVRLTAQVPAKGIYGVNITVSEDRYGEDIAWGFRTNCPHYLVETSRGHKDAQHVEPLVLLSPERDGSICFRPWQDPIQIHVTGLPANGDPLSVYDHHDTLLAKLPVSESGEAKALLPEDPTRGAQPWRLHLPRFQGIVHIDGLTRWVRAKRDTNAKEWQPWHHETPSENLSLWTPTPTAWFDFYANRWLLTPYSRTHYLKGNTENEVEFQVYNNSTHERAFALSLEYADESLPFATLQKDTITLGPFQDAPVVIACHLPESHDAMNARLRVTPMDGSGVTTYSTIRLRRGAAPASAPIPIPHQPQPYQHENELFGYTPDYPLTNEVYFDIDNKPVITSKTGIAAKRGKEWHAVTKTAESDAALRLGLSKVAFDNDNGYYAVAVQGSQPVYLHSRDEGAQYTAYPIPMKGGFDIEQFSGHNHPSGPPPFVCYTLTAKDPKIFWRHLNDLHLFLPEKNADGTLTLGDPVLLTKKCIGFSAHSGIPSSIVSRGDKVHVAWAEATEPDEDVPGVPTFVATYDRVTKTLSTPALVGYGPPANDVHNTPCITIDSQGFLHVLVGTHGRTFRYAKSLKANDAAGGWTEAIETGPGLRQTYVGLVCDKNDTLHLVFRLWFNDRKYFPTSHYATLSYMQKPADGEWSEARPLIVAPFSEYSIFYHRLTIDRKGQLYLSYDYWSTFWFYRMDHRGSRRALLTSPDQGSTWLLPDSL